MDGNPGPTLPRRTFQPLLNTQTGRLAPLSLSRFNRMVQWLPNACRSRSGLIRQKYLAAAFQFSVHIAHMNIRRGEIIGRRVGEQPKEDAEHFILCPACNGWIDCRDLCQVREHAGPLPNPRQGSDELKRDGPMARKKSKPSRATRPAERAGFATWKESAAAALEREHNANPAAIPERLGDVSAARCWSRQAGWREAANHAETQIQPVKGRSSPVR